MLSLKINVQVEEKSDNPVMYMSEAMRVPGFYQLDSHFEHNPHSTDALYFVTNRGEAFRINHTGHSDFSKYPVGYGNDRVVPRPDITSLTIKIA